MSFQIEVDVLYKFRIFDVEILMIMHLEENM